MVGTSEATIFDRAIRADRLSPDAARVFLDVRLADGDFERMTELCEKNGAGEITPEEMDELGNYRRIASVLTVMHSRARVALKSSARLDGNGPTA